MQEEYIKEDSAESQSRSERANFKRATINTSRRHEDAGHPDWHRLIITLMRLLRIDAV